MPIIIKDLSIINKIYIFNMAKNKLNYTVFIYLKTKSYKENLFYKKLEKQALSKKVLRKSKKIKNFAK